MHILITLISNENLVRKCIIVVTGSKVFDIQTRSILNFENHNFVCVYLTWVKIEIQCESFNRI